KPCTACRRRGGPFPCRRWHPRLLSNASTMLADVAWRRSNRCACCVSGSMGSLQRVLSRGTPGEATLEGLGRRVHEVFAGVPGIAAEATEHDASQKASEQPSSCSLSR